MNVRFVRARGKKNPVFDQMEPVKVNVGILPSEGSQLHKNSTDTVATIGEKMEFGFVHSFYGNEVFTPPRSWLLMPVREEMARKAMKSAAKQYVRGEFDGSSRIIGTGARAAIMMAFGSGGFGSWDPLSPITLSMRESRGNPSDQILVDTGELMNSVKWERENG